MSTYGRTVRSPLDFTGTVARVRDALAAQGFGVLTEIDVQATLKAKLGVDSPPYLILGACNPPLTHRALQVDPEIGLLLPCNVVVRQHGDQVLVHALDPQIMVNLPGRPELAPVAEQASQRLDAALHTIAAATSP